jgi:DNA-binding NtrC family response regulator
MRFRCSILKQVNTATGNRSRPVTSHRDLLGGTPRMQRLFRLVQRVAPSESTILITGERGTGKELVARAIHLQSKRSRGPFVAVHSGSVPETLIESELFGYARGAFAGAATERRGFIEEADGGTLFFDEIAELPAGTQLKLLRFLETREFRRLGDNEIRIIDARVITATKQDLADAVAGGEFREDLYYRLNVVNLELPPLRERKQDIPLLASYFRERYSAATEKTVRGFSPEAQSLLMHYEYPGNVRELENAVQRAVTLCDGEIIQASDLPPAFSQPRMLEGGGEPGAERDTWSMAEVEKEHIIRVLKRHRGNLVHTARQLGISRTTLWRKMKQYGIEKPRKGES